MDAPLGLPKLSPLAAYHQELKSFADQWEKTNFITDCDADSNTGNLKLAQSDNKFGGFWVRAFTSPSYIQPKVLNKIHQIQADFEKVLQETDMTQLSEEEAVLILDGQNQINRISRASQRIFSDATPLPDKKEELVATEVLKKIHPLIERVSLRDMEKRLNEGFDPTGENEVALLSYFRILDALLRTENPAFNKPIYRQLRRMIAQRSTNRDADLLLSRFSRLISDEMNRLKRIVTNERFLKFLTDNEDPNGQIAPFMHMRGMGSPKLPTHKEYLLGHVDAIVNAVSAERLLEMINAGWRPRISNPEKIWSLIQAPSFVAQALRLPFWGAAMWKPLLALCETKPQLKILAEIAFNGGEGSVANELSKEQVQALFADPSLHYDVKRWLFDGLAQGPRADELATILPNYIEYLQNSVRVPLSALQAWIGRFNTIEEAYRAQRAYDDNLSKRVRFQDRGSNIVRLLVLLNYPIKPYEYIPEGIPAMSVPVFKNYIKANAAHDFATDESALFIFRNIASESPVNFALLIEATETYLKMKKGAGIDPLRVILQSLKDGHILFLVKAAHKFGYEFVENHLNPYLAAHTDRRKAIHDLVVFARMNNMNSDVLFNMTKDNIPHAVEQIAEEYGHYTEYHKPTLEKMLTHLIGGLKIDDWEANKKNLATVLELTPEKFHALSAEEKTSRSMQIVHLHDFIISLLVVQAIEKLLEMQRSILDVYNREISAYKNPLLKLKPLYEPALDIINNGEEDDDDIATFLANKQIHDQQKLQAVTGIADYRDLAKLKLNELSDLKRLGLYAPGMSNAQLYKNLRVWNKVALNNQHLSEQVLKEMFQKEIQKI